ncbi:hypothetical protein [Nostoc sp.]|uniref:hypothetical protein n=1 Tax=Nostoc sp. TaxID=1180 RepID=UPI002FF54238
MEVKWYLDLYLILTVLLPSDRCVLSPVVPLFPVSEPVFSQECRVKAFYSN